MALPIPQSLSAELSVSLAEALVCGGTIEQAAANAELERSRISPSISELAGLIEVLFGVQLGGGTDINSALAYCEQYIEHPTKTHLILISDLFEGGNAESTLVRIAAQAEWRQGNCTAGAV
jgi:hypothetical protein